MSYGIQELRLFVPIVDSTVSIFVVFCVSPDVIDAHGARFPDKNLVKLAIATFGLAVCWGSID